ncbi:MAG: N-acetylmuramoyl-L-alanine amidase [Firmicutes bacterium]|nr:N-acetylmuramoyl-L-alanine amidase [Bacillota bacterium]
MAGYQNQPRGGRKRKKYRLQNPFRFVSFLAILGVLLIALIILAHSCSRSKDDPDKSASHAEESGETMTAPVRQIIAWTIGVANMTHGLDEEISIPVEEVPIMYTVVIDPGCGGADGGNPGVGGIREKEITMQVGEKLRQELAMRYPEIRVVMTRTADEDVTSETRTQIINEAHADMAISLHCDYFAGSSERRGASTYFRRTEGGKIRLDNGTEQTLMDISRSIASVIQLKAVTALETDDRGIAEERFEILNATLVPTVLLEMGYISDQSDYDKITSSGYQDALAAALADGINDMLKEMYPLREPEQTAPEAVIEESSRG